MAIIIGIDPGSRITGYGIISHAGDRIRYLEAGTIRTDSLDMPTRLQQIFAGLDDILKKYHNLYSHMTIESAIEQVFMASNPDSALKLGQARGCAITALVVNNITVSEYSAKQIKQAVCVHGNADKIQVQTMVCRILNLAKPPAEDASDALACAICHAHSRSLAHQLTASSSAKSAKQTRSTRRSGRWTEEDVKALR